MIFRVARFCTLICLSLLLLVLVACAPAAAPAPPAVPAPTTAQTGSPPWQDEWNRTVATAKKEGKLVIYSIVGPDMKAALSQPFKERFGIDIQWVSGVGTELNQKIFSERRAGLYFGDLYIGGSTPPLMDLKPAGVLTPLRPLLILPEVLDARAYFDNEIPFIDVEGKYVVGHGTGVANTLAVNSDLVKPGDLKGYSDLLDPRWEGKIAYGDPTIPGTSFTWFMYTAMVKMTPDFHRQFIKQKPAITRDTRQHVEWVARGKYSIAVSPYKERVAEFQKAGAPLKWMMPAEGLYVSASSTLSHLDRGPHPNATRVFINWFLSKDGLTAWSKSALMQSARADVPTDFLAPEALRVAGTTYFNTSKEEVQLKVTQDALKLARELYGPLTK